MEVYAGIDLHSSNNYIGIINEVESIYNWYWLVDALQGEGRYWV